LLHLPHLPDLSRLPRFSRMAARFEAMSQHALCTYRSPSKLSSETLNFRLAFPGHRSD
jgi:hypothetical protein